MVLQNAIISGALVMQMAGALGHSSISTIIPSSINLEKYASLVTAGDLSKIEMIEISADEATKLIGECPNVSTLGGIVPELNANSVRVYQFIDSNRVRKNIIEILQFGIGAAVPRYFLDEK